MATLSESQHYLFEIGDDMRFNWPVFWGTFAGVFVGSLVWELVTRDRDEAGDDCPVEQD